MNFRHKHIFLLPGLLVLIGILIFPILFTIRLSLSSWDSFYPCLLYTSPSPRDLSTSRMPSSA